MKKKRCRVSPTSMAEEKHALLINAKFKVLSTNLYTNYTHILIRSKIPDSDFI